MTFSELPILTKEARSLTRGWRRWFLAVVAAVPLVFCVWIVILWLLPNHSQEVGNNLLEVNYSDAPASFQVLLHILQGVFIFLTPAQAAGGFARERERHTLEMLLLNRQTSAEIVLGKLAAALLFLPVLLLYGLPVVLLWALLDPAGLPQFFHCQFVVIADFLFLGALGMYCSTYYRRVATAVPATYGAAILTLGVIPLIALFDGSLIGGRIPELVRWFGIVLAPFYAYPVAQAVIMGLAAFFRRPATRGIYWTLWLCLSIVCIITAFNLPNMLFGDRWIYYHGGYNYDFLSFEDSGLPLAGYPWLTLLGAGLFFVLTTARIAEMRRPQ